MTALADLKYTIYVKEIIIAISFKIYPMDTPVGVKIHPADTPVGVKIYPVDPSPLAVFGRTVFDFSSRPVANAMKNSSGLWHFKIP